MQIIPAIVRDVDWMKLLAISFILLNVQTITGYLKPGKLLVRVEEVDIIDVTDGAEFK